MIELRRVTKTYGTGAPSATVLHEIDLSVQPGEIAAVVGPSGAGKSTLAKCINLLERPTSGNVIVNGEDLTRLRPRELRRARQSIGTVFQGSNLLRRKTAAENIALPLTFFGVTPRQTRERVAELLDMVGLSDKGSSYPAQLSGGQRQRVGIARALALRPSVLLADEATSGLDPSSTASILALLRRARDELDLSVVLITHEMDVVREVADTVSRIERGRIVERGAITSLLTNPDSPLALELIPARPPQAPDGGCAPWDVVYARVGVNSDWLVRLSVALGRNVGILSATIESVDGAGVGRLTLAIDSALDDSIVRRELDALGLRGTRISDSGTERLQFAEAS